MPSAPRDPFLDSLAGTIADAGKLVCILVLIPAAFLVAGPGRRDAGSVPVNAALLDWLTSPVSGFDLAAVLVAVLVLRVWRAAA